MTETPSAKPAILFVDDEARVGRLLKMMFRGDYDVHVALGARDAIAILETTPIDVIVSDQRMPEINGVQLLTQVRTRWPDTVRLLLTGYSDLVSIIASINEGEVHRFLNKPWDQHELRDAISEAAELAESFRTTKKQIGSVWNAGEGHMFSISSKVLVIDEREEDLEQIRTCLIDDYSVRTARSVHEAIDHLANEDIGVVVSDTKIDGLAIGGLLQEILQIDPSLTSVVATSEPHSDAIIRLINSGRIFRFTMKPLSLNLFRAAVGNAMREHHRRLADPRIVRRRMRIDGSRDEVRQRFLDYVGHGKT